MQISLEKQEHSVPWNWISGLILAFCAGLAIGNGHTTQGAIVHISDQLGQAKKAAKCEKVRGDKAAVVAEKAIVGAIVDTAPIPSPAEIPKDCPPSPATK